MTQLSRTRLLVLVLALGVPLTLGACAPAPAGDQGVAPSGPSVTDASVTATDGCPVLETASGLRGAVDYADVVRFGGQQYLSHQPAVTATAAPAEVGAVQFRVRCSFGELNQRTGLFPPALRDGDSGWIPAGTEMHALRGWPVSCRLVAQRDGTWLVYSAVDPAAASRPAACAPLPTG